MEPLDQSLQLVCGFLLPVDQYSLPDIFIKSRSIGLQSDPYESSPHRFEVHGLGSDHYLICLTERQTVSPLTTEEDVIGFTG